MRKYEVLSGVSRNEPLSPGAQGKLPALLQTPWSQRGSIYATSALDTLFITHYKSTAVLGKGGFGTVHLAVDTHTGDLVAMKIIADGKPSDMKEIETMRNPHHVS